MNYKRFLDAIKRQINKVATSLKSRDVVTFLLFTLLAFGMWFMHAAGTQRELRDTLTVKYIGVPHNVRFDHQLPNVVSFVIKDEGKQLRQYKSSDFDTLLIDLSSQFSNKTIVEIEFEKQLQKILSQLSPTIKIVELTPGYFTSSFVYLHSKKVPIRFSNQILLAPQHILSDDITVSNEFVTVYGSSYVLDTLSCLYLQPINHLFSKTQTLDVEIINDLNLDLSASSVSVTVPVEMCTEKILEVPIRFKNIPKGMVVKTFPSSVKVKFSLGVSLYKEVGPDMFTIGFDYNKAVASFGSTYELELWKSSDKVSDVKIIPSEVEYAIERED